MCLILLAHLPSTNLSTRLNILRLALQGKYAEQIIKVFLHVDFREDMLSRRSSLFLSTILLLSLPSFYGGINVFQNLVGQTFMNSALYLAIRQAATVVKSPQPKNTFEVSLFENVLLEIHWKS